MQQILPKYSHVDEEETLAAWCHRSPLLLTTQVRGQLETALFQKCFS
jgi:hypothetical protein